MKTGINHIGVAVIFYCTDGSGNFLFHKRGPTCRNAAGTWDLGAGEVEFGETLEEALFREIKEEYGCDGEIIEQLPAHSAIVELEGNKTHWVDIVYIVKVDPKKVKIVDEGKISEIMWKPLKEHPNPLHPGTIETFKILKNYLKWY